MGFAQQRPAVPATITGIRDDRFATAVALLSTVHTVTLWSRRFVTKKPTTLTRPGLLLPQAARQVRRWGVEVPDGRPPVPMRSTTRYSNTVRYLVPLFVVIVEFFGLGSIAFPGAAKYFYPYDNKSAEGLR